MTAFPPLHTLLPHEAPMILLDEVVAVDGDRMTCAVTPRLGVPFVEPTGVHPVVAIEYMAQCIGAWVGLRAQERGEPVRLGFLLGCREMQLHRPWLPLGTRLTVQSLRAWGDDDLGSFECQVDDEQGCVATALLSVARAHADGSMPG